MLSFLQNFGKRKPSSQPNMTRSESIDSALLSSTNGTSSKGDKDSTPATSMGDTSSVAFDSTPKPKERTEGSRSLRPSRSNVSSYNENVLSGSAKHGYRYKGAEGASRAVSGETLVEGKNNSPMSFAQKSTRGLDQDWSIGVLPGDNLDLSKQSEGPPRRKSTRLSVFEFASNVMEQTRSVLGKRRREETGTETENPPIKQEAGILSRPQVDEASFEAPASKRPRLAKGLEDKPISSATTKPLRKAVRRGPKRWLTQGLYLGQDPNFDARLTTTKNNMKKANAKPNPSQQRSLLPLPMFGGKRVLETGRNFRLPFNVFSPLPPGQPKPDEWKKTHKNVFIGDAAAVWRKTRLESSRCVCTYESGCDSSCLNRHMFYECDDTNCNVGAERCSNRSFEKLKERHKKGGKYNIGVEVIKTADRGYGVRSNRTFEPHQIIVEYTGEIITQDECDDRMENRYKDNECFYLMEFDQRMILDATRGSIARFINHSCAPNCEMIKMTVAGKPRMALFAGDAGIMTGEELTYDYNFNPYSVKNVQQCRCGAESCRGVLGPKPKEIRDALKAVTGGKRKFGKVVEEGIESVVGKKRKVEVVEGVRKVIGGVKAQTEKASKKLTSKQEEDGEETGREANRLRESKSTEVLERASRTKTTVTYSRRRSATALAVKEEEDEEVEDEDEDWDVEMGVRRRTSSVKAKASSVRKNVVRTVKRGGRSAATGRTTQGGKSIRVIDDV